ncbi:DUF2158 domain-containing protein [Acinetobacter larvae]|uniref:DUF2158 domain-containing protein n=1 Tax=Acinetobacter larvae TaxID=1789224 RepID=UPI0009D6F479|nr:DUF2158 domain-containing protein [Acinetobacter larvae]
MTIEIGSVVVFVLGGPEMMVYSVSMKSVACKWICPDGHLQKAKFKRNEIIATGQKFLPEGSKNLMI